MFISRKNTTNLYLIAISLLIPFIGAAGKAYGQPLLTINTQYEGDFSLKVAISPDGKQLLGGLQTAKIWDTETGREILHYTNNASWISSAVFSPDGRHIFTGIFDFRGQYWDMVTGENIFIIKTFTWTKDPQSVYYILGVTACDFTPDGSQLITGDSDGEVQLWDTTTGKEIRRYEPRGDVRYIKVSPDGKTFLKQESGSAYLVDIETGEKIGEFPSSGCRISSNWKYLLSRIGNIYDVNTGEVIRTIPGFHHSSNVIALSPDGKYAILGGYQDSYSKEVRNRRIFNNETGSEIRSYATSLEAEKNAPDSVDSYLQFFPDGKRFLTVNGSNIHIWDISDLTSGVKSFDSLDQ